MALIPEVSSDSGVSSDSSFSSDGWESDSWDDYVTLPTGVLLTEDVPNNPEEFLRKHFLTQKYPDGQCKFSMVFDKGWVIKRLCPCGLEKCLFHVDGFAKLKTRRSWRNICKFPLGHELFGYVNLGREMDTLKQHYDERYRITQIGDRYEVEQVCPCKKTHCAIHIIPSTVELEHSDVLWAVEHATKSTPKVVTRIEPIFRKQHAMTFAQTETFFEQFELKWKLFITATKIVIWMICKCGQAFPNTPCQPCAMKKVRKCHLCGEERRSRMLKKCHPSKNCTKCRGICSDCKAAEVSKCEHCKQHIRLDHICAPLPQQHVSFRKNTTYPALLHSKGAKAGICQDCKEPCSYRIYHRHQYRRHNDLKPSDLYDRDYKRHFCPYCWYDHFDPTNVRDHINSLHSLKKTHKCKLGCGLAFTHACSEVAHRRKYHKQAPPGTKRNRRVGQKIILLPKKKQKTGLEL